MERFLSVLLGLLALCSFGGLVNGQPSGAVTWTDAHATFYGGYDNSGTMNGACGYGDLFAQGYGVSTTALSNVLFNDGLTCGACFAIICKLDQSNFCYPGASITVTATNNCPQGSNGGWCDFPNIHFDLSFAMFSALSPPAVGVIPVQYMRVACAKIGGIRFSISGSPWQYSVLVFNVGGAGDVQSISIRGDQTDFLPMSHNWGQVWTQSTPLVGQSLTFMVTVGDNGFRKTGVFWNIVGSNWAFWQTFESPDNFYW